MYENGDKEEIRQSVYYLSSQHCRPLYGISVGSMCCIYYLPLQVITYQIQIWKWV